MIILGIETSCDETAISVVEAEGGLDTPVFKVLGNAIHSQIDTHQVFGGVVPRLAKREHQRNLLPVLAESLSKAKLISAEQFKILNTDLINDTDRQPEIDQVWNKTLEKVGNPGIDMIAVTVGPGLEPALWTGITFAKILGEKWQVPVHGENHMEGHIASVLLDTEANSKSEAPNPKESFKFSTSNLKFPAIALLVSGGHTELILLNNWLDKKKIGETQDDAVGEAFDKVARMLQLPYPGGPEISRLAEEARAKNIKLETKFPRPMIHSKDFNFSFSGLKTAVLYYLKDVPESSDSAKLKLQVAREFEDAVAEVLVSKTKLAIEKYDPKTLIIGGGVIANKTLRENFLDIKKDYPDLEILIPEKQLTTDNATMIAMAAYVSKIGNNKQLALEADGNLDID